MEPESRDITVRISPGTIITAILFMLLVVFLYFLFDVVLILLTAIVIASAIEPIAKMLIRYKIPRTVAVVAVYAFLAVFLFGLFYIFIPPLLEEAQGLVATLPQYISSLVGTNPLVDNVNKASEAVSSGVSTFSLQGFLNELQSSILTSRSEGFIRAISSIFGGLLSLVLVIVFSFYFSVQEKGVENFLSIVTPLKNQEYIINLWTRSQIKIGQWMKGQLVLAGFIGIFTWIGLTLFRVDYALLLAVLAAIFEIIPVFGPILAAIPAIIVAAIGGGPSVGFIVAGFYLILQQFENHLLYPIVVKKVVGVPPLLVILALIIGAQVAGFLGIILSVPIAAAIKELVTDIQKERLILAQKGETS